MVSIKREGPRTCQTVVDKPMVTLVSSDSVDHLSLDQQTLETDERDVHRAK